MNVDAGLVAAGRADDGGRERISVPGQIGLSALWLSLNFQSGAFYAVVVPAQILLFVTARSAGSTSQGLFLGVIGVAGGIISLLLQPLAGALSDSSAGPRCVAWLGRRRPYVVAGALIL